MKIAGCIAKDYLFIYHFFYEVLIEIEVQNVLLTLFLSKLCHLSLFSLFKRLSLINSS